MKYCIIITVFVFFISQVSSETLKLAAGLTVEPYIIQADDSGFEADIVREAFALEGYEVRFIYQPLYRTKVSFKRGSVDGVMTIKEHYPEIQNSYISDEYITYHNYAVTLEKRNLKINTISDLKDKRITAFQQAHFAFGKEFKQLAESNPEYKEMANQKHQIAKLFGKRTDVIVLDSRILRYYIKMLKKNPDRTMKKISFNQPITYHNLFQPSMYRMAFRSKKIRDAFNRGLKKLRDSGRYKQIIDSYVKEVPNSN